MSRIVDWLAARSWIVLLVLGGLLVAIAGTGLDVYWQRQLAMVAIYTMLVAGLNLTFGYAGELALGNVAFFAAGAYVTGVLVANGHTSLPLLLACSLAVVGVLGLVTGLPSVRLGGWTIAIVSLFALLLVPDVIALLEEQTGGPQGLPGIFDPTLFGRVLTSADIITVTLVLAVLTLWLLRNVVTSPFGLAVEALRESDVLAQSLAIRVRRLRLVAYVVGSLPAAVAGTCYALLVGYLSPTAFNFTLMVALLAASILGGSWSVYGAPVGAAILVLGPLRMEGFANYSTMAYGLFLTLMGLLMQGGLAGLAKDALDRFAPALRPVSRFGRPNGSRAATTGIVGAGQRVELASIDVGFGGVVVLDAVSMQALPGQVTAIIGANGAGKTTMLNVMSGFVRPAGGAVRLGEVALAGEPAWRLARLGVRRTFQTPRIQRHSTVLEVVQSGQVRTRAPGLIASALRLPGYWRWRGDSVRAAVGALELVGLGDRAGHRATSLPLGERRLLEVARAVAGQPTALLLDEPAAGLDPRALDRLAAVITTLRAAGVTVVLVEHNVPFVLGLADHVVALEFGRVIAAGTAEQVRTAPAVIRSYLGEDVAAADSLTGVPAHGQEAQL